MSFKERYKHVEEPGNGRLEITLEAYALGEQLEELSRQIARLTSKS